MKQSKINVRPSTKRKIERIMKDGNHGSLVNTVDVIVERFLSPAPIEGTRRFPASSDHGDLVSPL